MERWSDGSHKKRNEVLLVASEGKAMNKQLAEFYARKFFPHLGLKYGVKCVLVACDLPDDLFD